MSSTQPPVSDPAAGREVYRDVTLTAGRKETRLLRLFHDCSTQVIRAELFVTPLDNPETFKALSYAWGEPDPTAPIQLNGRTVSVNHTVFSVLQKLRQKFCTPDAPANFWIDSLCIDQGSTTEKNHQVPLMGDIYTGASQVIVWLGDCNDMDSSILDAFRTTLVTTARPNDDIDAVQHGMSCPTCLRDLHGTGGLLESDFEEMPEERPEASRRLLQGALTIYDRLWFTRTWILQEAALPNEPPLVLIGNRHIDFDTLVEIADRLPHSDWCEGLGLWQGPLDENIVAMYDRLHDLCHDICNTVAKTRYFFQGLTSSGRTGSSIELLLHTTRRSRATNACDKVYGLLGLSIEDDRERIAVDYGKSKEQVYMDVVLCAISKMERGLQILSMVDHQRAGTLSSDWPTWVPDFSAELDPISTSPLSYPYFKRGFVYQASGFLPVLHNFDPTKRSISVFSFNVDSVQHVTDASDPSIITPDQKWHPSETAFIPRLQSVIDLFYGTADGVVPRPDAGYEPRLGRTWVHYTSSVRLRREAIWRCMIGNLAGPLGLEYLEPEHVPASEGHGEALCDWIRRVLPARHHTFWGRETPTEPQDDDHDDRTGDNTPRIMDGTTSLDGLETPIPYRKHLLVRLWNIMIGRKAFRTQNGWIGFGPLCMEPGDIIAVLIGGDVPFVLRPDPARPGSFFMVGQCYVEGLMFGELFGDRSDPKNRAFWELDLDECLGSAEGSDSGALSDGYYETGLEGLREALESFVII